MKCQHCSAEVETGKFCEQCGGRLESVVTVRTKELERTQVIQPEQDTEKLTLSLNPPVSVRVDSTVVSEVAAREELRKSWARRGAPQTIISHWSKMLGGMNTSSLGFYRSVKEEIEKREVPDVDISQVEWAEGGPLSAKRAYLRVRRRDLVFDICAAPFGSGFFFSWWLGEVDKNNFLNLIALLLLFPVLAAVFFIPPMILGSLINAMGFGGDASLLGFIVGMGISLVGLPILFSTLVAVRNVQVSDFILRTAIIGPIYERYFHPVTFYKVDTTLMFQSAVHAAVMAAVDQLTDAKGIRTLTADDRKPIMREFEKW